MLKDWNPGPPPPDWDDDENDPPGQLGELDPDCCPECGDALNVYGYCPACELFG